MATAVTIPTTTTEEPPLLLSRAQSARLLALSERRVDQLYRAGVLTGVRVGGRVLLHRASVVALAEHGTDAGAR